MLVKDIINNINKLLSNNTSFRLSYERLKFHLDSAIDNINRELLTNYPTIQEMYDSARGYYYMVSLGYNVLLLYENNNYYLDESTGKLYYRDNTKNEFIYTVNTNAIDGLYNENNCSSYIIDNNNEADEPQKENQDEEEKELLRKQIEDLNEKIASFEKEQEIINNKLTESIQANNDIKLKHEEKENQLNKEHEDKLKEIVDQ